MLRRNENTILKLFFFLEKKVKSQQVTMDSIVRAIADTTASSYIFEQYSNLGPQTNILFSSLLCKDCNSLNAIKQVATSRRRTKQFLNISVQLSFSVINE